MSGAPDWLRDMADRDAGTPAQSTTVHREGNAPGTARERHNAAARAAWRRRQARRRL